MTHRMSITAHRGLALALGILALGALFGLDVIYVLHYTAEAACAAEESGDPYDCFVCTSLFTMGLDLPVVALVAVPEIAIPLPPPDAVVVAFSVEVRRVGARSPPPVSA
jgi:hypothetical protein